MTTWSGRWALTPRYAVPMDDWTLYDNTGLKAETATWTSDESAGSCDVATCGENADEEGPTEEDCERGLTVRQSVANEIADAFAAWTAERRAALTIESTVFANTKGMFVNTL